MERLERICYALAQVNTSRADAKSDLLFVSARIEEIGRLRAGLDTEAEQLTAGSLLARRGNADLFCYGNWLTGLRTRDNFAP